MCSPRANDQVMRRRHFINLSAIAHLVSPTPKPPSFILPAVNYFVLPIGRRKKEEVRSQIEGAFSGTSAMCLIWFRSPLAGIRSNKGMSHAQELLTTMGSQQQSHWAADLVRREFNEQLPALLCPTFNAELRPGRALEGTSPTLWRRRRPLMKSISGGGLMFSAALAKRNKTHPRLHTFASRSRSCSSIVGPQIDLSP